MKGISKNKRFKQGLLSGLLISVFVLGFGGDLPWNGVAAGASTTETPSKSGVGIPKAVLMLLLLDSKNPGTGSHASRFTAFDGTRTCLECHRSEAEQFHGSVHYQWKGDSSESLGFGGEDAGKLGSLNDFCGYPDINWIGKLTNTYGVSVDAGCARCHVGLGAKPSKELTEDQLENIDCLVCHAQGYRRTVAQVEGTYRFVPDTGKMSVSLLQAAQDITLPSKGTCLNCHAKSGGGDNFKRGDLEEAHRDPSRNFDVHLASEQEGGAGLSCLDCHVADNHRIAGRGTDLRPLDSTEEISCTRCHTGTPHENDALDRHTARVNCTVCHIPVYAKIAPTDMERDWSMPGEFIPATGLYEPYHLKESSVTPVYRFFNGLSHFYLFGDPAPEGLSVPIIMSEPDGDIHDVGARIHAFKQHWATLPADPETGRLLPLKIGKFFETGDLETAVELGTTAVGWPYSGFVFAETERHMGLFHEVSPKEEALSCSSCHVNSGRLDFSALGYDKNWSSQSTCATGCHGSDKAEKWDLGSFDDFEAYHKKHVDDKGYGCRECHTFSAAE